MLPLSLGHLAPLGGSWWQEELSSADLGFLVPEEVASGILRPGNLTPLPCGT